MSLRAMAALGGLLCLSACDGVAPGEYVVYRVGFNQASLGADCYADGEIPENIANDSSTFLAAGTLIVYRAPDASVYLDNGAVVMAGTDLGKGSMSFSGASIDVEKYEGYGGYTTYYGSTYGGVDPKTLTTELSTSIQLTLDSKGITGTETTTSKQACQGKGCEDFDTYSCTGTSTFVGTEVKDADIEYQLDGGTI